ncbi:envelope biogenesis factor ElyC, partial [Vibrio vulnificus]
PTNYLAQKNISQAWDRYAPKAIYLEQTERYWYETLGQLWQGMRDLLLTDEQIMAENRASK